MVTAVLMIFEAFVVIDRKRTAIIEHKQPGHLFCCSV